MLLVALGCGRLPGMLDIASNHPFVVFGTMNGEILAGLDVSSLAEITPYALKVYFYETG